MATFFLDPIGGNDANDGTSFANRWKTIAGGATAARIAPGDFIRIKQSPAPQALSSTVAWTSTNRQVVLTSALNKTVDTCDSAWTGATNVTSTAQATNRKNGTNALSLAIAAAFTTGQVAFKDLGSTQDFSAYQQVCFWIRCSVAVAASTFRLDLCSDALGVTPVESFTITDAHQVGNWLACVFNKGSALSSTVRSVALTALLDPGTVTVNLDIVFASKASGSSDELTLHSLISKANGSGTAVGDVQWWKIMGIDGVTIDLDGGNSANAGTPRGYYGVTETVTTYARQPLLIAQATTASQNLGLVQDSGTAAAYITFSGGWDSTNMSTQPGDTFIAVNNGFGVMLNTSGKDYIAFEHLHVVGFAALAVAIDGLFPTLTDCGVYASDGQGFGLTGGSVVGITLLRCVASANVGQGFNTNQNLAGGHVWTSCTAISNNGAGTLPGYQISVQLCRFFSCVSYNNGLGGWAMSCGNQDYDTFYNCTSNGNGGGSIRASANAGNIRISARKCNFLDSPEYAFTGTFYGEGTVQFHDNNGSVGTHATFGNGYNIQSTTALRHTASGLAWQVTVTNTTRAALFPVKFKLADVACASGTLVTISVWVQRNSLNASARLICPGLQISGSDSDVTADAAAAINTWEQLTITFTPSEANVVSVFLYCWCTATSPTITVDDMTISQA